MKKIIAKLFAIAIGFVFMLCCVTGMTGCSAIQHEATLSNVMIGMDGEVIGTITTIVTDKNGEIIDEYVRNMTDEEIANLVSQVEV